MEVVRVTRDGGAIVTFTPEEVKQIISKKEEGAKFTLLFDPGPQSPPVANYLKKFKRATVEMLKELNRVYGSEKIGFKDSKYIELKRKHYVPFFSSTMRILADRGLCKENGDGFYLNFPPGYLENYHRREE